MEREQDHGPQQLLLPPWHPTVTKTETLVRNDGSQMLILTCLDIRDSTVASEESCA